MNPAEAVGVGREHPLRSPPPPDLDTSPKRARGRSRRAEPTHSLAIRVCIARVYCVACSHSPQMFPCGSTMAATAPTPGIGVFGSATCAPSFVAFWMAASMLATST